MVKGFRTSSGSVYEFDKDGYTQRLKLSGGIRARQGKITPKALCVFLSKETHAEILRLLGQSPTQGDKHVPCIVASDKQNKTINEYDTPMALHEAFNRGENVGVAITKGPERILLGSNIGTLVPQVGLYPFEIHFKNGSMDKLGKQVHSGSQIDMIFEDDASLIAYLQSLKMRPDIMRVLKTN